MEPARGRQLCDNSNFMAARLVLRSRSLSPDDSNNWLRTRAYAVVGATEGGVVIGPMPARKPQNRSQIPMKTPPPTAVSSSRSQSRPVFYRRGSEQHDAIQLSNSEASLSFSRSKSSVLLPTLRSISSRAASASAPSLSTKPLPALPTETLDAIESESRVGSDSQPGSRPSTRTSSRTTTTETTTGTVKGLVSKFKFIKEGEGAEVPTVIYLTPEEARERERRIKRAFGNGMGLSSTGALGV